MISGNLRYFTTCQQRLQLDKAAKNVNTKLYECTVNLPKTQFPMRANAAKNEQNYRYRCTEQLYRWQMDNLPRDSEFLLHDGPPYANGDLHIGHALNKILKDIINRFQVLKGRRIHYRPGWDCHGLPIELKVLSELKKPVGALSPIEIRKHAKQCALTAVNAQMAQFKHWGIMADWDNPYLTLNSDYEASQLKVFREMFRKGLIYRKYRPVYWSPWTRTALAEAELEYAEKHQSRSVYVKMKLNGFAQMKLDDANVYALIWTTTPWTLPANRAISANPSLSYVLMKNVDNQDYYVIAKNCISALDSLFPTLQFELTQELSGSDLIGCRYQHPFDSRLQSLPIIPGDHVTDDSGTGLVHTAPGHGFEDYEACKSFDNIEISCPVDGAGKFTAEAGDQLDGLNIFNEGTEKVLEMLGNHLVKEELYVHKYPYDWRTKKPIIIRATKQWFANVSAIKPSVLDSLQDIEMIPKSGKRRLSVLVENRNEWCISRQRAWGVPIPVFYHKETGEAFINESTINHFIKLVESRGSNAWWELPIAELLPPLYANEANEYEIGKDTMDVWFDSGTSWKTFQETGRKMADLYLEGSDQHRGWFQSSILTSIAAKGSAPYKTVITHGFVTDENGRKMSKSVGNVIEPSFITDEGKNHRMKKMNLGYGVDVMRLWISSTDYTRDVSVGQNILKNVAENMRKIRNTARFLLGNLYDFDPQKDLVSYQQLNSIDKYMLSQLHNTIHDVTDGYESFEFAKIYANLTHFTSAELSSFYFDIVKPSLFNDAADSLERKSTQTVFYHTLRHLMTLIAPIAPHFAEELFEHYQKIDRKSADFFSVFQLGLLNESSNISEWNNPKLEQDLFVLKSLRDNVNVEIENLRQKKEIGSSLQAHIKIVLEEPNSIIEKYKHIFEKFFIVASCDIQCQVHARTPSSVLSLKEIIVEKSKNHKCPRCRAHVSESENELCVRCFRLINTMTLST